jgi:biopolymer transport protein ExbD
MRRLAIHRGSSGSHINVTPLIDVVMCLIVFYLIVGRLASTNGQTVAPPATGVGDVSAMPRLVVNVARAETGGVALSLAGSSLSLESLGETLRLRLGDPAAGEVAIRADRRLSWGEVRPVVEACRAAGLTSVKLVTERTGGVPR